MIPFVLSLSKHVRKLTLRQAQGERRMVQNIISDNVYCRITNKEVTTMKKLIFLLAVSILLVMACSSSTDPTEKYFEPVEEQYKIIEVPIITEVE